MKRQFTGCKKIFVNHIFDVSRMKKPFLGGLDGKESACKSKALGSIQEEPLVKGMATYPTWKSYGQRCLVGYSP